jgi:hypothetical protein
MAPRGKLTDSSIAAICASEINAAEAFDTHDHKKGRERALAYFLGDMSDTPAEEGRSHAQTSDTADVIEWMLPGIMRVFFGSDRIVDYDPDKPGDEEGAEQASDFVNYIFEKDGNGYQVLWDAFHDALTVRKGIVKFWWDDTPEYSVERYTGLSDDAFALVVESDEIEVLTHTETEVPEAAEPQIDPATGQPVIRPDGQPVMIVPKAHDVKIRRVRRKGRIRLASVPGEEFGINAGATSIQNARFIYHKTRKTRSDLIEAGYSRKAVNGFMRATPDLDDDLGAARVEGRQTLDASITDKSTDEIDVYECYLQADVDNDGIAEWIMVVMAGGMSDKNVLEWEEWGDPLPFIELDPMRVPHRWMGRSIADSTMDVQQIKTVLLRQTLDNIYEQNHPQKVAVEKDIVNPESIINPRFNGVIRVKSSVDSVKTLVPQFMAQTTFGMLEFLDDLIERRTGVSRSTMALDPNTLQNQTATAVNAQQSAQYSKVELVARNFALGGLSDLFRGLLKLVVMHQDRAQAIRLRDEWVEMDPRGWNAEMDVTINTGLGTGSRERDLSMLMQVLGIQREIMAAYGPDNGMVTVEHLYNTIAKIVEAAGMRNVEQFFTKLSPEEVQQKLDAQASQPDPKVEAEQARLQMDGQRAQAEMQIQMQAAEAKLQQDAQRHAAEMQFQREKHAAEIQIKREEIAAKSQARLAELEIERDIKLFEIQHGAQQVNENVARPE